MALTAPEVNVLVDAWNPHSAHHEQAQAWLEEHPTGGEPLGLSELVLSGAVRVLTMPKIRTLGHDQGSVLERVEELMAAPGVVRLRPGARHWGIFRQLCAGSGAVGTQVPDCVHTALPSSTVRRGPAGTAPSPTSPG